MKYLVSFGIGLAVGIVTLVLLVYYNPLFKPNEISPLSVTENEVMQLNYSVPADDALLYTNNGESQVDPHPPKALQLWEQTIRKTTAVVTVLLDSRNQLAGIGIKFSSLSERTNVLASEALVDAVWHIYLPEKGSMFIEQTENYWDYLRTIVIPAYWSSGDNWRGLWRANITVGPTALETARVAGGSGKLSGMDTEAVEALSVSAYSVDDGPVAASGELFIEILPASDDATVFDNGT